MLNKVIIINFALYTTAELQLGEASSIQLVGQNNVGKSSLVNTLNFLYITDLSPGHQRRSLYLHHHQLLHTLTHTKRLRTETSTCICAWQSQKYRSTSLYL